MTWAKWRSLDQLRQLGPPGHHFTKSLRSVITRRMTRPGYSQSGLLHTYIARQRAGQLTHRARLGETALLAGWRFGNSYSYLPN
jgi:hypothetical protein